jgi:hypothetical protein
MYDPATHDYELTQKNGVLNGHYGETADTLDCE